MSSICYTIGEDSSVYDPSGCRICRIGNNSSNGWKKISIEDYYNPQTDDYPNCSAFYRCCEDSGFTITPHEVMLSFYTACLVGMAVYQILLYRKKRALEEKFISEGVSIQATLTEQWSEPVMVGPHNNSEHSNSYREAVPTMEFTNTLGETVVRGTSLCRSTQGRHISGQSLTIHHLPDYPQSALESYKDRQQSQNCGLLLLALIGLVWCITYIGLCAGSYYVPFWYGLVRQLLVPIFALPLMAGLVYFATYKVAQRGYLIYEDDVLRNVQRTSKNFQHRRIIWGKQTEDGEWTMATAPQQ